MNVTGVAEDYLKAVLKIEESDQRASTSGVARVLNLADATVTDMLRKLQQAGLLEYRRYHGASLTRKGREVALKVRRRHRLIELFLHEVLGYRWDEVHDEAEQLEHVVSERFVERIDGLLEHPKRDPHGALIPDASGFSPTEVDAALSEAKPGEYLVQRITDEKPDFLRYLEELALFPGTRLNLIGRSPFGGPVTLQVGEALTPVYLGPEAAAKVFVVSAEETHKGEM